MSEQNDVVWPRLGESKPANAANADAAFRGGDVVRLKSGGPAMVVSAVLDMGEIKAFWTDDAGQLQGAQLPADCFRLF